MHGTSASSFLARLVEAVNRHDVDAVTEAFAEEYQNLTPAHPGRGFVGRAQVHTNWERIFGGIPDITATVLASAIDGNDIWSEWEMAGVRCDGERHLQRGVIIFRLDDEGDRATSARFYLEPVDAGAGGVTVAISQLLPT